MKQLLRQILWAMKMGLIALWSLAILLVILLGSHYPTLTR